MLSRDNAILRRSMDNHVTSHLSTKLNYDELLLKAKRQFWQI